MSNKILSIDVRDNAISAILISSSLKGNNIESHCHVRFDQAPLDIENRLFWAISQIADQIDIAGATCLLSVPPSDVTYRNVKLPFKERRKIGQLLPFELESGLPCAVEDLKIDFKIVRKADHSDILAAAVNKEKLDELTEILNSFDIRPRSISIGPIAEAMSFAKLGMPKKPENFLFLSIDDTCATACLVFSGTLHLSRTFRLPQNDSQQRIKRLKTEILRITAAFENIYDFDFVFEQVMISCVGSNTVSDDVAAISAELNKLLEADVKIFDIFNDVNFKMLSTPSENDFERRLFNSAMGLAGIEIGGITPFNFNGDHHNFRKYWEENRTEFITTGVFIVFIFVLIMTNAIVHNRSLENQISKMDKEITGIFQATLPGERMVNPQHQMRVEIDRIRQRGALSQNSGAKTPNIDILNEISRLIPGEIDLLISNMVRSDNHITISGTISNFNAVDEVKVQLEKADLFEKITISSATMDTSINRVRFRIRADLAGYQTRS